MLTYSKEKILSLLESPSEEAARLRSSSPFTGILSQSEREEILKAFKQQSSQDTEDGERTTIPYGNISSSRKNH